MIFADKLIQLRKKSGWSQEELAEQMNVTRQSVSKWEGAQSVPDLDKMVRLSKLFGVSTDYLLKDELEEIEHLDYTVETTKVRSVSMEEAFNFLNVKAVTAKSIAYAVFLCIISPICLLILGAMSETPKYGLSENTAGGIGMIVLLIFVSIAVATFISSGSKTASFDYLEKEIFETEYGVSGMVKERKAQYKDTYTKNNVIGTCMCILSLLPLFGGVIISESDVFMTIMLSITIILAGIGVIFFIRGGIVWASFEKLLQEGDYSKLKKEKQSAGNVISTVYWSIIVAVYLAYSFITNNWRYSWIIWPVAGVLYPAITVIFSSFNKQK
ncbi:helix-turn-helix domain-containing protein [Clostridium polynesiense]|uniref:helix-turn-helix domain-containing protein n=1 Tax=Clostridium polynesiense TaxID=1325933 RepID=UPI00058B3FE7|nr:helix-turn-helix transcriptional regulator [Clostridium polynesiense]